MPEETTTVNPEDFFEKAKAMNREAKERHEAEAEADEWKPKPNPSTLRGYFMKADRILTQHGPRYKVFVKDYDTETTVTVFCGPKLLREGILDASPKPGTLIMFEYDGEHKGQRGFNYGGYYIKAAESDEEYWAKITTPKPGEQDVLATRQAQQAEAARPLSGGPEEDPY